MALPAESGMSPGQTTQQAMTPDRILQGQPGGAGQPLPSRRRKTNPFGKWRTKRVIKKTTSLVQKSVEKQQVKRALQDSANQALPLVRQAMELRQDRAAREEEKKWQREATAGREDTDELDLAEHQRRLGRSREAFKAAERQAELQTGGPAPHIKPVDPKPTITSKMILDDQREQRDFQARQRQFERQRKQREKERAMLVMERQQMREDEANRGIRQAYAKYGPPDEYGLFHKDRQQLGLAELNYLKNNLRGMQPDRESGRGDEEKVVRHGSTSLIEKATGLELDKNIFTGKERLGEEAKSRTKIPTYFIPDNKEYSNLRHELEQKGLDKDRVEAVLQLTAWRAENFTNRFKDYLNKHNAMPSDETIRRMEEAVQKDTLSAYGDKYLMALDPSFRPFGLGSDEGSPYPIFSTAEMLMKGLTWEAEHIGRPISEFVMPKLAASLREPLRAAEETLYYGSAGKLDARGDASDAVYDAVAGEVGLFIGENAFVPSNLLFAIPVLGAASKLMRAGKHGKAALIIARELTPFGIEPFLVGKAWKGLGLASKAGSKAAARAAIKNFAPELLENPGFIRLMDMSLNPEAMRTAEFGNKIADLQRVSGKMARGEAVDEADQGIAREVVEEARKRAAQGLKVVAPQARARVGVDEDIEVMDRGAYGIATQSLDRTKLGIGPVAAVLETGTGRIAHGIEHHPYGVAKLSDKPISEVVYARNHYEGGKYIDLIATPAEKQLLVQGQVGKLTPEALEDIHQFAKANDLDNVSFYETWETASDGGIRFLGDLSRQDVHRAAGNNNLSGFLARAVGETRKGGLSKPAQEAALSRLRAAKGATVDEAAQYAALNEMYGRILTNIAKQGGKRVRFKEGERVVPVGTRTFRDDEVLVVKKDNGNGSSHVATDLPKGDPDYVEHDNLPNEYLRRLGDTAEEAEARDKAAYLGAKAEERAKSIVQKSKERDELVASGTQDKRKLKKIDKLAKELDELEDAQRRARAYTLSMQRRGALATAEKRKAHREVLQRELDASLDEATAGPAGEDYTQIPGVKAELDRQVEAALDGVKVTIREAPKIPRAAAKAVKRGEENLLKAIMDGATAKGRMMRAAGKPSSQKSYRVGEIRPTTGGSATEGEGLYVGHDEGWTTGTFGDREGKYGPVTLAQEVPYAEPQKILYSDGRLIKLFDDTDVLDDVVRADDDDWVRLNKQAWQSLGQTPDERWANQDAFGAALTRLARAEGFDAVDADEFVVLLDPKLWEAKARATPTKPAKAAEYVPTAKDVDRVQALTRRVMERLPLTHLARAVDKNGNPIPLPDIKIGGRLLNEAKAEHLLTKGGKRLSKYEPGAKSTILVSGDLLKESDEEIMLTLAHEFAHHVEVTDPAMKVMFKNLAGSAPLRKYFKARGMGGAEKGAPKGETPWQDRVHENFAEAYAIYVMEGGRRLFRMLDPSGGLTRALDDLFKNVAEVDNAARQADAARLAKERPELLSDSPRLRAARKELDAFDEAEAGLKETAGARADEAAKAAAKQAGVETQSADAFSRVDPPKSSEADPVGDVLGRSAGATGNPMPIVPREDFMELADYHRQHQDALQWLAWARTRHRALAADYKRGAAASGLVTAAKKDLEKAKEAVAETKRLLDKADFDVPISDNLDRARKSLIQGGADDATTEQTLAVLEVAMREGEQLAGNAKAALETSRGAREWWAKLYEFVNGNVWGPVGHILVGKDNVRAGYRIANERTVREIGKELDSVVTKAIKSGAIKLNEKGLKALEDLPANAAGELANPNIMAALFLRHPELFEGWQNEAGYAAAQAANRFQVYQRNRFLILEALGYDPKILEEPFLEAIYDIPKHVLEMRRTARTPGKVSIARDRPHGDLLEGLRAGYKPKDLKLSEMLRHTSGQFDDAMADIWEKHMIVRKYGTKMLSGERGALKAGEAEFQSPLYRGYKADSLLVNQIDRLHDPANLPALQGLTDLAGAMKNTTFGVADVGVVGVQVMKALMTAGIPGFVGLMNRSAAMLHLPHFDLVKMAGKGEMEKRTAYALMGVHQGYDLTAVSMDVAGRSHTILRYVPGVGPKLDDRVGRAVTLSARIQYGHVLTPMRNHIFEGHMLLGMLTGQKFSPENIKTWADAANAATGASHGAKFKGRQAFENIAATSASMTRAELAQLTQIAKIAFPPVVTKVSPAERIVALTTLSTIGTMTFIGAQAFADTTGAFAGPLDILRRETEEKGFFKALLEMNWARIEYDGFTVPVIPSRTATRAIARSIIALAPDDEAFGAAFKGDFDKVLVEIRELKPEQLHKIWLQAVYSKMAPAWKFLPALGATGFDMQTGEFKIGGLDATDAALSAAPIPPLVGNVIKDQMSGEEFDLLSTERVLNVFGYNTYPTAPWDRRDQDVAKFAIENEIRDEETGEYVTRYGDLDFVEKDRYDETDRGKAFQEEIAKSEATRKEDGDKLYELNQADKKEREEELWEHAQNVNWGEPGGGEFYRNQFKDINSRHSDNYEKMAQALGIDISGYPEAGREQDKLRDKYLSIQPTDFITSGGTEIDFDAYYKAKNDVLLQMSPEARAKIRAGRFGFGNEDLNNVERRRAAATEKLQLWMDAPKYKGVPKEKEKKVDKYIELVDQVRQLYELKFGKRPPSRRKILELMYRNGLGDTELVGVALITQIDALKPMIMSTVRRDLVMENPDLAVFYDFTYNRLGEEDKDEWTASNQFNNLYNSSRGSLKYGRLGGFDDGEESPEDDELIPGGSSFY